MFTNPHHRRVARAAAWVAAFGSAVGLFVSTAVALGAGSPSSGEVTLAPISGSRSTVFNLSITPSGNCPGDATTGFRWSTFITPLTNDPATLTYTNSGNPIAPTGTTGFTGALRLHATGELINAENPGLQDGLIAVPLGISFANVGFNSLTPGDYWIGIACTKADTQAVVQTEKFWASHLRLTAADTDGFTFATVPTTSTTTTSAASTTTTVAGATSTTVVGGTTTTRASTTTTSAAGGSSTTTTGFATSTTAAFTTLPVSGGFTGGVTGGTGGGTVANTGASERLWMVIWAVLLVAFGRMAILLGRSPHAAEAPRRT
jgi:hypothetical protein